MSEPAGVATTLPLRERVRGREGRAELLLFRVGRERFALELSAVAEATDLDGLIIHPVPRPSATMLGVLDLRGVLVPLHGAAAALGVPPGVARTALVMRAAGRMALAVDDAEDVLVLDLAEVRPAPHAVAGGALLGVVQKGNDLIGLVDGDALVAVCRADPSQESS